MEEEWMDMDGVGMARRWLIGTRTLVGFPSLRWWFIKLGHQGEGMRLQRQVLGWRSFHWKINMWQFTIPIHLPLGRGCSFGPDMNSHIWGILDGSNIISHVQNIVTRDKVINSINMSKSKVNIVDTNNFLAKDTQMHENKAVQKSSGQPPRRINVQGSVKIHDAIFGARGLGR